GAVAVRRRVSGIRAARAFQSARDRGMVAPSVRGLNCPQCGAAIQLRSGELARTVACSSCAAILDAKDPNLRVLQEYNGRMRWTTADARIPRRDVQAFPDGGGEYEVRPRRVSLGGEAW